MKLSFFGFKQIHKQQHNKIKAFRSYYQDFVSIIPIGDFDYHVLFG